LELRPVARESSVGLRMGSVKLHAVLVSRPLAGVGLKCGIGVALEMAGRRSPKEACRLTQGSLAWASNPGLASLSLG
jgi:hypothetical protein